MNALTGQMLSLRMKHNQEMLDYIRQMQKKRSTSPTGAIVLSRAALMPLLNKQS